MANFQFRSAASAFNRGLQDALLAREKQRQQAFWDELMVSSKMREQARLDMAAQRQAEQDRIAAENRAIQRSQDANAAGMWQMTADALLQPDFANNRDYQRQVAAGLVREGQAVPSYLQASLQPEPVKEPRTHVVTTVGPDGRPVRRLVTEDELIAGVPEYREPRQPREPNYKWVLRDGVAMHVREEQIRPGDVPYQPSSGSGDDKPATEGQRRTEGLLSRAQDARAAVDALESGLSGWDMVAPATWMQSAGGQRYRQAAKQWIQSVLRDESGAAIGADEEASYFATYFRQPGDSEAVIAQKQQARNAAEAAMRQKVGGGRSGSRGKYQVTVRRRGAQ